MIGPFQRTITDVVRGPGQLDGVGLTGLILSRSYVFQLDHATADDVNDWEVGPTRLSATGAVTSDATTGTVTVGLTDLNDVDLTAVSNAGWIAWFLPGATDADQLYIGASLDDSGNGQDFTPIYDDGLYIEGGIDLHVTIDGGSA